MVNHVYLVESHATGHAHPIVQANTVVPNNVLKYATDPGATILVKRNSNVATYVLGFAVKSVLDCVKYVTEKT